jgi:gliding motility-associated-like protein
VDWGLAGTGTVTLNITNQNGCDSTITQLININQLPATEILGPDVVCAYHTDEYSVTAIPGSTYSWQVTGGTILGAATGIKIDVRWNGPGLGSVKVTETNSSSCINYSEKSVIINPTPEPVISGKSSACAFTVETYSVAGPPTDTYIWSVIGGGIVGFSVGNSVDILWGAPGAGTVSVRQINSSNCDSMVSKSVIINTNPAPAITGNLTVCANSTHYYSTQSLNGGTYEWIVDGGYINGPNTNNTINVTWSNLNFGNITLNVTNSNGCTSEIITPVNIQPRPAPFIAGDTVGCANSTGNIYQNLMTTPVISSWTVTNGVITSGNGSNTITVDWLAPGTQTITLTVTDPQTLCDSTITYQVKVETLNQPVIIASSFSGCSPVTVSFTGNNPAAGQTYYWSFGDGSVSNAPNPTHTFTQPGNYNVTLVSEINTGCNTTVTATVNAYSLPVADFSHNFINSVYYISQSSLVIQNTSTGGISYFWDFGNGDQAVGFEPEYTYTVPGIYTITLIVTNQSGCKDTITKNIEVKLRENFYIPNAFSPNGDNINDYFRIYGENLVEAHIIIFNRWGEMFFAADQVDFKWDGTYKGFPVPIDVYSYIVKAVGYHGETYDRKGTVTVVR